MTDPLCLEDSFRNLARILPIFSDEKIQEQMGEHVVSKCKEDEFEEVGVTNFGFMEEIGCPLAMNWKKGKAIKRLRVKI